ncbi:MAG: phenylacetate--CoA ligase [Deltaproteobacteria bacterium]|nr:MAG: phenylacetate--CoA ligase [Deltaproteobacteria bacterium]
MRHATLLGRVAATPFYRGRVAEGNLATWDRLPLTRREELLRDQLDHLPLGTRRFADAAAPVRVGVTGSGDGLLVLAWSPAALARERAAGVRLLRRLGVGPGTRVANSLPGALATPGALLLGDVVEEIGALDVPLGSPDTEPAARQAWELVDRVEPAGFSGWQRHWLAVPEAASFVAHSCAASRYHVDERVEAEVVDVESGAPVAAGREGMLALTPVEGDTALLRYASGLGARMLPAPCGCGEAGTVMEIA